MTDEGREQAEELVDAPKKKSRKHRRADGTLRPTYRRYRQRNAHKRLSPARRAWLANFEPGARKDFFRYSLAKTDGIWLGVFAKQLGLEQEEAAPMLERVADERGWRKLRTKSGMVVGIAPPKHRPPETHV